MEKGRTSARHSGEASASYSGGYSSSKSQHGRISRLMKSRTYSNYGKTKKPCRTDGFEKPRTDREYWRNEIRDTPNPGHYNPTNVTSFKTVHKSFNNATPEFINLGRKKRAQGDVPSGKTLLPGCYENKTFVELMEHKDTRAPFKNTGKDDVPLYPIDWQACKGPQWYLSQPSYPVEPPDDTKKPKELVRFPMSDRLMKITAPPCGAFNPKTVECRKEISSPFKSTTDRFHCKPSPYPECSAYQPVYIKNVYESQQAHTNLQVMAAHHGAYFRPIADLQKKY